MQATVLRNVQHLLESWTEPSWKGWEDESACLVECAGLLRRGEPPRFQLGGQALIFVVCPWGRPFPEDGLGVG